MAELDEISGFGRCIIGAFGGLAAVASKYLGQDHSYYLRMLDLGNQSKIDNLWIGYYIMAPLLLFLGALVAWASYENHRLKLLAIAVAAPALITTWAGGATSVTKFAFSFIDQASAQTQMQNAVVKPGLGDGIKLWFGIGRDEQKYRVVVGSFKKPEDALLAATKINKTAPDLKAFVGEKAPGNDYYAVVISDFLTYPDAKKVLERASKIDAVDDAYLSPYWR
jgi:hypothetical protein